MKYRYKTQSQSRKTVNEPSSRFQKGCEPGFALIVTVAMLVMLTVIALGLLSLAQIDTRSSNLNKHELNAKHNAVMALKHAIGELQLSLGPDQMVSANAAILSDDSSEGSAVMHPHWMGAWHSWRAGDSDSDMSEIDDPSDHQTIPGVKNEGMHPSYVDNRSDHFRNWLVSLTREEANSITTPLELMLDGGTQPDSQTDSVCLVSDGTLGPSSAESDKVRVRLIDVREESADGIRQGRYGWWVGDESQKARVMGDPYRDSDPDQDLGDALFRQQSPGSTGTLVINGLENITDDRKLSGLPSLQTINLVNDVNGKPSVNFHSITSESSSLLTDVREGGLKRDLSILLEQPINLGDTGDEFMLYRFDDKRVPIQDLTAYYQLYDDDPNWSRDRRGGIIHRANGRIRVETPDFGPASDSNREKYLREYSSIYRNPVPIKVEFLLAMTSKRITDAQRDEVNSRLGASHPGRLKDTDTHRLLLGVMPTVTLWNPYNVPVHMNHGQRFVMNTPPFGLQWVKRRANGYVHQNGFFNINSAQDQPGSDGRATRERPFVMHFAFAQTQPIVFEPGEVKIFSLPTDFMSRLTDDVLDEGYTATFREVEPVNGYDPYGFYVLRFPCTGVNDGNSFNFDDGQRHRNLVFNETDTIAVQVIPEGAKRSGRRNRPPLGANTSIANEVFGAGFHFHLMDEDFAPTSSNRFHFHHYNLISRYGGSTSVDSSQNADFNLALMTHGFPGKTQEINIAPRLGRDLIALGEENEVSGFLQFSMKAGCELSEAQQAGYGSGRRNTSRPFLHGSTIIPPFMDQFDANAVYNYGWEWQMDDVSDVDDSSIQDDPGTGNGFFGGGYSAEAGSTHVVQQYLPVAPPMSIAALSSAHLGGYSLANAPSTMGKDEEIHFKPPNPKRGTYRSASRRGAFYQTTVHGQGGLAPNTMQAIGNSYAHPNIAADEAYTTWTRFYDSDQSTIEEPFVDHAYLANKALWDEFTFSSITPQRSQIPLFSEESLTAKEVAENFFFSGVPLPNSRIKPVLKNMNPEKFEELFSSPDSLANRITTHLMLEGGFNINSTSVDAWIVFLSSLRGKAVASLDEDGKVQSQTLEGVPVGAGEIPAGATIQLSDIESGEPNVPEDQWRAWRELSDDEIYELAHAIVRQVKLRGPFLSLSEFVNRRLDASYPELSTKGALQAALDDPEVSINSKFRSDSESDPSRREFQETEITSMFNGIESTNASIKPAFREAMDGAIAYGSTPYVDQADILRHLGSQITPRGDTFVIRTYGDSLDSNGNVAARAWCEAVVQRMPDYVDDSDDPHLSYADLPVESTANRRFGRKLEVISFRWLHASEL